MARHDDDDDDDRPRSRGRDDDDDANDDRPRKKKHRDDDDDEDWDRRKRSGGGGGGAGKVVIIVLVVAFCLLLVCAGIAYMLIMPAVSKVREAAARMNEMNNLKQVSLGLLNQASNGGRLPKADGDLSWRVHILPYIEQDAVYRQFDLKSPWNQGRNASLGDTTIKAYQSPLDDPPTAQTHYRVFTGDGSVFDTRLWNQQFPMYVTDGTANTILAIETADTVPWPAPKEVLLQAGGQFPEFGHPMRTQILIAMCDGSTRFGEKKTLDAAKIRAMATAAGGEVVADW